MNKSNTLFFLPLFSFSLLFLFFFGLPPSLLPIEATTSSTPDIGFDLCLSPLVAASLGVDFKPLGATLCLGQKNCTTRDLLDICLDVDVDLDLDVAGLLDIDLDLDIDLGLGVDVQLPVADKFLPKSVVTNLAGDIIYVAETATNRILRFKIDADIDVDLDLNLDADLVIGQLDFDAKIAASTRIGLNAPVGLALGGGKLFVADSRNHRILRFDTVNKITANAPPAAQVIGQTTFRNKGAGLSRTKLNLPVGLCYDDIGDILWVADSGNNRVLRYDDVSLGVSVGLQASAVLGAPNFLTLGLGVDINAQAVLGVRTCVFDTVRNALYVVSDTLHRVLRFDNARSHPNFAVAAAVFGQVSFNNIELSLNIAAPNLLFGPIGISLDLVNDLLFVAEKNNNRVVVFKDASKVTVGPVALTVLGQLSLDANLINLGRGALLPNKRSLYLPTDVWFNGITGKLWVADFLNARLVVFPGCKAHHQH